MSQDKVNILLVDDQPENLATLQAVLEGLAQNLVQAQSGREALRALLSQDFAVILLDVHMPVMGGYETAQIIRQRERTRATPIIFLTASFKSSEATSAGYAAGAVDFLYKPVVPEILVAKVSVFIEMARKDALVRRQAKELREQRDILAAAHQQLLSELRQFFEMASDLMCICTLDLMLTQVNTTFSQVSGFAANELCGRSLLELIHPDEVQAMQSAILQESEPVVVYVESSLRGSDGVYHHVSWSCTRSEPDRRFYLVGRDVTEKRKLQQQMAQAQKMEAVGQLAGGVAHDFNNLLTVINGSAELASDQMDRDSDEWQLLESIKRAGMRAADLTRQLLLFSRQQVIQPRVLDLNILLKEAFKMLGRLLGANIEQRIECAPDLPKIKIDPGQIEQVLMNLAVNARDAMPRGGQLIVTTSSNSFDEDYTRSHLGVQPGPHVCLCVSDTGTGMDEATIAHIFEPFFTTKEAGKGTGLGLSTAFGIVQQAGGHINVRSEVGRGTSFEIYLPAAAAELKPTADPVGVTDGTSNGGGETVLIVEDQQPLQDLAARVLERAGYHLLRASNGEDALEVVEANRGPLDLLLTDLVMPRMNGPEMACRLSQQYPALKVVYMSGYSKAATEFPMELLPDVPFLQKPFGPADLLKIVRQVLDFTRAPVPDPDELRGQSPPVVKAPSSSTFR